MKILSDKGMVQTGDKVVLTYGVTMGKSGHTDSMRVYTV